jgi:hypothetical protein
MWHKLINQHLCTQQCSHEAFLKQNFQDKLSNREQEKPICGMKVKWFCRRKVLLIKKEMKNSILPSSQWKESFKFFMQFQNQIILNLWRIICFSYVMSLDWVWFLLLFAIIQIRYIYIYMCVVLHLQFSCPYIIHNLWSLMSVKYCIFGPLDLH